MPNGTHSYTTPIDALKPALIAMARADGANVPDDESLVQVEFELSGQPSPYANAAIYVAAGTPIGLRLSWYAQKAA